MFIKPNIQMLLFFILISTCYTLDPVPVSNFIGNGFDYKTGTYGLAPIFQFTYTNGAIWTTPFHSVTYKVPDQMFLHSLDYTYESVTDSISQSYSEFYQYFMSRFTFKVGIDIGKYGGGFLYDRQTGFIKDMIKEQYVEFMHGTHYLTYCIGSMYPAYILSLDPMFNESLMKFPRKIVTDTDKALATEFVQSFGQFYVYRAKFGGRLDFNVALSETLVKSYDKEWTITQEGLYFHYTLFNISAGGFTNQSDIKIDSTFLEQSNANTTFYGGDPTFADLKTLDAWMKSIDINLYPTFATFVPLWTLVEDPIKQATMKEFVLAYIAS